MKKQRKILIGTAVLSVAAVCGSFGFHSIAQKNAVDVNALAENDPAAAVQQIQKTDVDEEKAYDPELYASPDPADEPTKYEIYYKCLNTLEALDQLSGTITIYEPTAFEGLIEGSFEFDFSADQYHAVIERKNYADSAVSLPNNHAVDKNLNADSAVVQRKAEYFNDAGHCFSLYDYMSHKTNEYIEMPHGPTMEGIVWSDKANIYATYGKDPTNAHELGVCFIPQEMSIGYLKNFDNWEVADIMDWNGRKCISIHGVAEPEYGSRFDVDTFQIWVDQETGIWYQYEGYNKAGDLTEYFYTDNMQFGDQAMKVEAFSDEMTAGYVLHDVY